MIFHIATRAAAAAAGKQDYRPEAFDVDGFVHCSTAEQVPATADAYYANVGDLVLLCIDPDRLIGPLRWESATDDGPRFPHVYGPLNPDAVVDVVAFERGDDGGFDLPWEAAVLARRQPNSLDELTLRLGDALAPYTGRWWVAGGWALDLHVDRVTRQHEDFDIAIPRSDVPRFVEAMAGWELRIPTPERLIDLPPGDYPPEQHQIWTRPRTDVTPTAVFAFSAHPLMLDVLIEDIDESGWRYRRAPNVTAPLERYARSAPGGLPYVAPEVQLLYKSKPHPTGMEHNDIDFAAVVGELDSEARTWLKAALGQTRPDHHWLSDPLLR
ncbi:MAG TPA: DUF952 domain-containing protein [Acidimicrobiales bacterium]|nr:DUF952 domain-containing protein [Acidimicrobiales bacterium]